LGGLGGDVDVDAGLEQGVGVDEGGAGTLGFAENMIRREAGEGNLGERFLLIVEDAVVELEKLLRGVDLSRRALHSRYAARPYCR
jgi:hypothetical protein